MRTRGGHNDPLPRRCYWLNNVIPCSRLHVRDFRRSPPLRRVSLLKREFLLAIMCNLAAAQRQHVARQGFLLPSRRGLRLLARNLLLRDFKLSL